MAYDSGLTATDIKDTFDTVLDDSVVEIWLDVAESNVDDLPSHTDLDSDRKEKITRFLTAALLTAQDPRTKSERHESSTLDFSAAGNMSYMEIAQSLDPTGNIGDTAPTPTVGTLEVLPYDDDADDDTDRDDDGDVD